MKILFLDVDGVLNTRPGSLDSDKVELLVRIVKETECRIVLSSSWRTVPPMLQRLTGTLGCRGIRILDRTPELVSKPLAWGFTQAAPRREEIDAWLKKQRLLSDFSFRSYAILDDMDYADNGTGRFVQTNGHEGLTEAHIPRIIQILNTPL